MTTPGVRGPISQVRDLQARLKAAPLSLAHAVAAKAGVALTRKLGEAHRSARTVYGDPRPLGVDGRTLTLQRTGATARDLHFRRAGRVIWVSLGAPYARYLIGKYRILPPGRAHIPVAWSRLLEAIVHGEGVL